MSESAQSSASSGETSAAEALPPDPHSPGAASDDPARARATIRALVVLLLYQGFTMAILGIASPWIAKSFGLDQSGIARVFAWISISSIGALALSRFVDRLGRRRVLLWCLGVMPFCALGAAASTNLAAFICFEILIYAFIGAAIAGSIVMFSEELPVAQRAKGQSYGGIATALGGGICVVLMPLLDSTGYSWRWLLVLDGAGILLLPVVARGLPESRRWARAAADGVATRTRFYDIFHPLYRSRAITLIICSFLTTVAATATGSWTYFHAVSVVGLSAATASTLVMVGGGVALLGFPWGAWAAERFGRVRTIVALALVVVTGALAFYWGPPAGFAWPALALGGAFCWFAVASNASTVAGNTAVTELFPTALRGTMIGWFSLIGAVGAITAHATVSLLAARMGGLSVVVGYLAMLSLPSAMLFGLMISETRGMTLEASGDEDAFRASAASR
ncbi:MAG: MFS transporter [Candidatus Binataceae bacterium]